MSLKRNFKVRVRDYKLAPSVEDTAPFLLWELLPHGKEFYVFSTTAMDLDHAVSKVALRYATKDTAPFRKRFCGEIGYVFGRTT